MTTQRLLAALLLTLAWACDDVEAPPVESADDVVELGVLDAKADGVVLREVAVEVAPGATKFFRIRTTGFRASLDQSTDQLAVLSAKHYDIEAKCEAAVAPTLEATADDTVRNWTLRVTNQGDDTLKGTLLVTEWTPVEPEPPFVGELGDELRREQVRVEPGAKKTFRIKTTRFHAGLTQAGAVPARLTVKHYDIEIDGAIDTAPTVQAIADVDQVRNWTLRVENHGDAVLEGEVVVHQLVSQRTVELGIISDIDKTIMPPETEAGLTPPYAGIVDILNALDLRDGGQPGDVFFVTARSEDRIAEVPDYFAEHGVPEGPISTGISGIPWIAQAEKVRDISAILDANPDQRFVLFGDASHRDPEAYREIIALYPGRIMGAYIHRVKNINETRRQGLFVFDNYAEVAADLFGRGLLEEAEAAAIMKTVVDGTDLTQEEADALLEAQQPE